MPIAPNDIDRVEAAYEEFPEPVGNKTDDGHQEMRERVGGESDPEEVKRALGKLR